MTLKNTIWAACAAAAMLLLPAAAAEAKTRVVIGIGTPVGGSYCWNHPRQCHITPRPHYFHFAPARPLWGNVYLDDHYYKKAKLSCAAAGKIVVRNGFNKIVARDCKGSVYSFAASRKGKRYIVNVHAYAGRVTVAGRI